MPFKLLKTRINTHYRQAIAPFINAEQFQCWLNNTIIQVVETVQSIQDINQESAHVVYTIQIDEKRYQADVRVVQSTKLTAYCFDVFIILNTTSSDSIEPQLSDTIEACLEKLRHNYNGNWTISDDDLTLSILQ